MAAGVEDGVSSWLAAGADGVRGLGRVWSVATVAVGRAVCWLTGGESRPGVSKRACGCAADTAAMVEEGMGEGGMSGGGR